ncbi:MAG: hypothetical protein ABIG89_02995 [Candidatus Woesearchaeota archaeon]
MSNHTVSCQKQDIRDAYIRFLQKKEQNLLKSLGLKIIKTQKKIFFCEAGKIEYMFKYVKCLEGNIYSPLREYLDLGSYQNMSLDFKNKLMMKASMTTYRKAVEDINNSFGFSLSRKTLNKYVIESCSEIDLIQEPAYEQNILIADSTKVRNGKGGHHEVMGVLSLDYENNYSSLTAFEVNVRPAEIAANINIERYAAFVGDADLGLRNFYNDTIPFHLCHQHAINDLGFFLWKEGMSKDERNDYVNKLKSILFTLQNSTKKNTKANKTGRLVNRIIRTKKNIRSLAAELATKAMHDSARFLMAHNEHMVTAARLALIGIKCPWTTNHAERLMQEIGIRTKKKGMNWTEKGLKAMLHMVLKRYFLPQDRRNYKEVFAKQITKVVET